jgi:hypothetical protein
MRKIFAALVVLSILAAGVGSAVADPDRCWSHCGEVCHGGCADQ